MGEVDQQIRNFGSRISLQTQSGENVSGVIFGCDSDGPERVMVVQQPGSTPFHTNLKIIKESYIESVSECTPPSDGPSEPLPLVDEQRCRDREERAVRSAQLEAAKIGLGVTVQGQLVFDSLAKTLPCKWQDKTIVVLDEVFISEPYGPKNCKSLHSDDTATMDRVIKILVAEKAKGGAN